MATDLTSLYRGALIGQALSKQMGTVASQGGDIQQGIRAAYLQSGVATGKIKPQTLSSTDTNLLGQAIAVPKIPSTSSGGILGILGTPLKILTNTGGDLVNAVESLPAGIAALGKAAYKTAQGTYPGQTPTVGGPGLPQVIGDIAKSTVHDFTHFDPMHPLYPVLDLASVVSGGTTALARGGGALARIGAATKAIKAGEDASRIGALVGKGVPAEKLGGIAGAGQRAAYRFGSLDRPVAPVTSAAVPEGVSVPKLPLRNYSISPFRRMFVEKPVDAIFNTKAATTPLYGLPKGTSLADLRGAYQVRKVSNVLRGRASAESIAQAARKSQGFNVAMQHLLDTSVNDVQAGEKFNALALMRILGAENMTPEERLAVLEEYRNKVLASGTPDNLEGYPVTPELKQIRDFNRKLTATAEYTKYFTEPDAAMMAVKDEWDKAILEGHRAFNIDPHTLLERSLGPAAFIRNKTPEELLREQPQNVQRSMNFARGSHDLEQSLKESGGAPVPEEALIPQIAAHLPGDSNLAAKTQLVKDAVESLRADIAGEHTPRELLNNAESTGYLPGSNLSQKVAAELPGRLGVPEHVAEPFASGGLTNYFPQMSALPNMMIRPNGGIIARKMESLSKGKIQSGASKLGLHDFKRENLSRLMDVNSLGVGPFASFLEDADLNAFKAGVDRRDPVVFVRHIAQREKVLVHRLLSEPFVESIAVKDAEGNIVRVANDTEKTQVLGSVTAAAKYTLMSPKALQALIQVEDKTALDVANALKESGEVTPELMAHIDRMVDESAPMAVRQLADEAIASKGQSIIVPNSYVQNLIKQAKVLDSGSRVGGLWQAFINKWRSAVLAYMPSWLLRTSVGHGYILFQSGVWDPRHYIAAMKLFDVAHTPREIGGIRGKLLDPMVQKLRNEDHHEGVQIPPGIHQGLPHSEFGQLGQRQYMKNLVAPAITGAVHRVANFQRRAAFLSILNRVTKQHFAELGEAFELPKGLRNATNLQKVIEEHPEWVHHAINELDRVSYTFGQMAPWERRLAKNILPFWGWYRFVSKFVWQMPFTYPGRTYAITRLGQIGESDQNSLGPLPDWLRASIMFDTHNLADVHYMSMLGLNPLGDVMNPGAGFQGLVRLGQLSPVIQAALEGAGYNTMTGGLESIDPASGIVDVNGKFVNIHTGKSSDTPGGASVGAAVERFFGGLARSFPEIRIGELAATKGYPVYPESVPFLYERRIPTTLQKDVSIGGILSQYGGVAPKQYDLSKYQQNLLKDIRRAISTSSRAAIKEKALP